VTDRAWESPALGFPPVDPGAPRPAESRAPATALQEAAGRPDAVPGSLWLCVSPRPEGPSSRDPLPLVWSLRVWCHPRSSPASKAIGPSSRLIPNWHTILLAIAVASARSLAEPVDDSPKTSSSAASPPMMKAMASHSSDLLHMWRSSSETSRVCPPAEPLGSMEIRCTGCACGRRWATTAWPASWMAITLFSRSAKDLLRRASPTRTPSRASSTSCASMRLLSLRTARRAASFITFSRSAPEKPVASPGDPL